MSDLHRRSTVDDAFLEWLPSNHPEARAEREYRRSRYLEGEHENAARIAGCAEQVSREPDQHTRAACELASSIGPMAREAALRAEIELAEPVTPEEALAAAEAVETETAYWLRLARQAYEAGRQAGFEAGYQQAEADQAARWTQTARAAAGGPAYAELEERRWGPGGRAHFADPRPGDFPGRGTQPRPEPGTQPEIEAST